MPVTGADLVAGNIVKFGNGFTKQVNLAMRAVEYLLDTKVTENMSLSDHSLEDLRKLGHPYKAGGPGLHSPGYQVHTQSGALLDSKSSGTIDADIQGGVLKATAYVKLDADAVPYAPYVIYGTSKMLPRPVLDGSRDEIKDDVLEVIQNNLKNLKASFA